MTVFIETSSHEFTAKERSLDGKTWAFIAWAVKYDINVNERGDRLSLDLGELSAENHRQDVRRILRDSRSGSPLIAIR